MEAALQAFLGTLFTWAVTALGAATVFCLPASLSREREGFFLDCGLGFGGGVMLAASYWSLLAPGLELAEELHYGAFSFVPAAVGVVLGAAMVYTADWCLPHAHGHGHDPTSSRRHADDSSTAPGNHAVEDVERVQHEHGNPDQVCTDGRVELELEWTAATAGAPNAEPDTRSPNTTKAGEGWTEQFRRTMLLVLAVTVHNFPEGMAIGVAFGGIGATESATFEKAVALALGIGIQNFPEGMAVALPLKRVGYSKCHSFMIGQSSGMVEPIGGVIGAAAAVVARPILPYAMAFAAGAMIFAVIFAIVPEMVTRGNHLPASVASIVGFVVMMSLDVVLG